MYRVLGGTPRKTPFLNRVSLGVFSQNVFVFGTHPQQIHIFEQVIDMNFTGGESVCVNPCFLGPRCYDAAENHFLISKLPLARRAPLLPAQRHVQEVPLHCAEVHRGAVARFPNTFDDAHKGFLTAALQLSARVLPIHS